MWVFRPDEHNTYEVGYFNTYGDFMAMYVRLKMLDAAQTVHFLNGGN